MRKTPIVLLIMLTGCGTFKQDRFYEFNDSLHVNQLKWIGKMLQRDQDSTMYYGGKVAAYMELESAETRR